jgi:hypothetical protein
MIDWKSCLYDPVYAILGVTATITPATAGSAVTLTVVDRTSGVEIGVGTGEMGTVRPAIIVRVPDLETAGLSRADLRRATVEMDGKTWRVESTTPRPSPVGESKGELYLILIED